MGSIRVARLIANLLLENVTIERRGRKGRKVGQDHSAAFAAFAFQCGSNRLRSEPLHRERFSADSWRNLVALRRLGYAACTNATRAHLTPPLASELPCPTMTRCPWTAALSDTNDFMCGVCVTEPRCFCGSPRSVAHRDQPVEHLQRGIPPANTRCIS